MIQQIDSNLYAIIYASTDSKGKKISINNILKEVEGDKSDFIFTIEDAKYNDSSERELIERAYIKLKNEF